jgi:hypothetical protein
MTQAPPHSSARLGAWGWLAILVLFGFLAAAIGYAIYGWNKLGAVEIPAMGWLVLFVGIAVTIAAGGGLMALMFYSSRKGRDI